MMIETTGITGKVVDLTTRFRAPREKVFQTWTDPKLIAKWFMPGPMPARAEIALEPLGPWRIVVPFDGHPDSVLEGHFFEVVPGRELVYSWHGNVVGGEHHTLVDATFEDDGDRSLVRLVHGIFRTDAGRDGHAAGWERCLSGLHDLLEG